MPQIYFSLSGTPRHHCNRVKASLRLTRQRYRCWQYPHWTVLACSHPLRFRGNQYWHPLKKAGGGFLSGAQSQEESIAFLYPTVAVKSVEQFYTLHKRNLQNGYYSHAMIYSPDVILFRDDTGVG
jgi:hypothetical protein